MFIICWELNVPETYPDKQTAITLWKQGITFRISRGVFENELEYRFHTLGIANSASKIAEVCGMDAEKAWVLGLLHDYGKRQNERVDLIFHAREGYEQMMSLGYTDVARICLTHSFPGTDFCDKDYGFYQKIPDALPWAHRMMAKVKQDDYDRLIQLCDLLFEGLNKTSFEERLKGIVSRYQLQWEQVSSLYEKAKENKAYFDEKCHIDIYRILRIKAL